MYTVNYGTGIGNTKHDTLKDAMAETEPTYTQASITIEDGNGKPVMISRWWEVEYNEEADENQPLAEFGTFGYYEAWKECDESWFQTDNE